MSVAVAYAPNRYSRVQMNMASLYDAPTKGGFIVNRCIVIFEDADNKIYEFTRKSTENLDKEQ